MSQSIYLVRHATPDWTITDIPYHLPPGPPLTEQGRKEAQALAAFLQQNGVCQLYSSPLERCLQTAQIIGEVLDLPVQVEPALIEWQPEDTLESVRQRTIPVFEKVSQPSQADGAVALITHGGPVSALLYGLGMDEQTLDQQRIFGHSNVVPPGGAWVAVRAALDEPWRLRLAFKPEWLMTSI